jgi:hypothetical protein
MANLDWTKVEQNYKEAIVEVAIANGVDMGVGLDMLIAMVCEPNAERRNIAIGNYGPIPEGLDQEAFRVDVAEVRKQG